MNALLLNSMFVHYEKFQPFYENLDVWEKHLEKIENYLDVFVYNDNATIGKANNRLRLKSEHFVFKYVENINDFKRKNKYDFMTQNFDPDIHRESNIKLICNSLTIELHKLNCLCDLYDPSGEKSFWRFLTNLGIDTIIILDKRTTPYQWSLYDTESDILKVIINGKPYWEFIEEFNKL